MLTNTYSGVHTDKFPVISLSSFLLNRTLLRILAAGLTAFLHFFLLLFKQFKKPVQETYYNLLQTEKMDSTFLAHFSEAFSVTTQEALEYFILLGFALTTTL